MRNPKINFILISEVIRRKPKLKLNEIEQSFIKSIKIGNRYSESGSTDYISWLVSFIFRFQQNCRSCKQEELVVRLWWLTCSPEFLHYSTEHILIARWNNLNVSKGYNDFPSLNDLKSEVCYSVAKNISSLFWTISEKNRAKILRILSRSFAFLRGQ